MANEWLEAFADYMQYRMRAYHQCPACGGGLDMQYIKVRVENDLANFEHFVWAFICMNCDAKYNTETLLPIREEE